jgi:hypothetical protein
MGPGNMGAGLTRLAGTGRKRAAVLAVAGTAAAATIVGLAVPAGASPVAARPAAISGTEHFQIMSTSPTSTTLSVISWGADTMAGVDHSSNSTAKTSVDTFVYPKGTFKVTHTNPSGGSFNAKTCLFQFDGKGTFKISGGTGVYKGISGSGKFTLSVIGLAPKTKSGACNGNANPAAQQQLVQAAGTIKIP